MEAKYCSQDIVKKGVALEKISDNDQICIQILFDRLPTNHQANKLDDVVEDKLPH